MNIEQEPVIVTVNEGDGAEGFGFYVWETDAAEEGYIWFGTTRPTADDLRAICPRYVEERSNGGVRCDVDNGPCACGAWH